MSEEKVGYKNKHVCHGYPGHKCTTLTYDYRCKKCWDAYRESLGLPINTDAYGYCAELSTGQRTSYCHKRED